MDDVEKDGDGEFSKSTTKKVPEKLEYGVNDLPPIGVTLFYTIQVTCGVIGGPITCAYFLYEALCPQGNQMLLAQLMSTSLFMVGITTFLQAAIGIRLPIIQGSSILYVLPALGLAASGAWPCEDLTQNSTELHNATMLEETGQELWRMRINDISGAIMLAAVIHTSLGAFGIIGSVMQYVGPIPIGTALFAIVIDLLTPVIRTSSACWIVSIFTAVLGIIFALFMGEVKFPCFGYNQKKGCHVAYRFPVFKLYNVILAMVGGWILSWILTSIGYYTDDINDPGYIARADAKMGNVHNSPWFYMPYPAQFGWPTFNMSLFISMLAATAASVADSIGDYGICSRICMVRPPPRHAVNRGILMEGLGTFIAGLVGSAHATTTYTGTMGLIVVTRMGSRRVYQVSGLFLMILGIFGKMGGLFSTIPTAAIGGNGIIFIGMLTSIAVTTLTACNMNLSRNRLVFGGAIGPALIISTYVRSNPGSINTGSRDADEILTMILGTCMLTAGILAIFLDNVTPGTLEERGIEVFDDIVPEGATSPVGEDEVKDKDQDRAMYDIPIGMDLMRKYQIFSYVPFLPVYKHRTMCKKRRKAKSDYVIEKEVEHDCSNTELRESFV